MKSKWYISNAFNEKAEMIFENWAKMSIQKVRYKQLKKQTTTMKIVDLYFFLRVWSWLRMNAGGMPKTCKSNGVAFGRWSACTKLEKDYHLVADGWVTRG